MKSPEKPELEKKVTELEEVVAQAKAALQEADLSEERRARINILVSTAMAGHDAACW